MDPSEHRAVPNLPLVRLVAHAFSELKKLRYSGRSLRRYRTVWGHLVTFSREMHLGDKYSEDLAARFVEAYQLRTGERAKANEEWRRHVAFLVKVLGDFARDGLIERTVTDMQKIQAPPAMKKPLRDYEEYCSAGLHLRPTSIRERIREITIFLGFLGSRNVTTLDQMQPADLAAFVTAQHRLSAKSVSRIVSDVRGFLRFLLLRGILQRDLTHVLPKIRVARDATIPSVWDPDLVVRLLRVVDRSSPLGKRDYAILLLASRLGLRLGDIRTLRLDDLKWDAAVIEFAQSKTRAPLCLPMTEEVGAALIDYLKSGRPQTEHREVFVKLSPPFAPFGENNLHYIVKHWKNLAGIRFRTKQRQGLHSLRHTLATQLPREETPFHVISEM